MAKQKEATLKVEKTSVREMSAEDRAKEVAKLQEEVDARNREMETKLYIVEGGSETGEKLLKFVTEEAQWKFTEAIGVVEMTKEIEDAVANAKGGKQLFLRVLPLEALWFFINKVEGVGLEKARYYAANLLKPIGDALARVKADRDAINELMMRQGSLEVGADFEEEVKSEK
jgi:hypothetical protein